MYKAKNMAMATGLVKSWKYIKRSTKAAMIGSASSSLVFGVNLSQQVPRCLG